MKAHPYSLPVRDRRSTEKGPDPTSSGEIDIWRQKSDALSWQRLTRRSDGLHISKCRKGLGSLTRSP
jgi:hypothetical protein